MRCERALILFGGWRQEEEERPSCRPGLATVLAILRSLVPRNGTTMPLQRNSGETNATLQDLRNGRRHSPTIAQIVVVAIEEPLVPTHRLRL